MPFSFAAQSPEEQLKFLSKLFFSLPKKLQKVFLLSIEQQKEKRQEESPFGPVLRPRIIKQPKRLNPHRYLSDLEKLVYVAYLAGLGSVSMDSKEVTR